MKTLKILSGIIAVSAIMILIGCTEENSPVSSGKDGITIPLQSESKVPADHFEKTFTLKNGESTCFNKSNTGIALFRAMSIRGCDEVKKVLDITGNIGDIAFQLNCNSKGFNAQQIIMKNVSGREIEVDLLLYGDVEIKSPNGAKGIVGE